MLSPDFYLNQKNVKYANNVFVLQNVSQKIKSKFV